MVQGMFPSFNIVSESAYTLYLGKPGMKDLTKNVNNKLQKPAKRADKICFNYASSMAKK